MTNYLKMPPLEVKESEETKKTVFTHCVDHSLVENRDNGGLSIRKPFGPPSIYKNVMLLWNDKYYGSVFKCWEENENDATIYFGTAGDEFK